MTTIFCKHCGEKIESESRFCSHCGGKIVQEASPVKPTSPEYNGQGYKLIGIPVPNTLIGSYLVWLLLHFTLLLVNWGRSNRASEYFYPFSERSEIEHYDLTEFLFYSIAPALIIVIYLVFKKSNQIEIESKYDLSYGYQKSISTGIFGLLVLLVQFLAYEYSKDLARYERAEFFSSWATVQVIGRIILAFIAASIAKQLNRNQTHWGFFTFVFPAIALLVLSLKRKYKLPKNGSITAG